MGDTVQRKRAPNYTNTEKERLLYLVEHYKNIIENKKTDGVSVKEKKDAWDKICKDFNSTSPNLHYRAVDSLKKFYEKMKEDLRKRSAEYKKELYKTGGGPGPEPKSKKEGDELLLSIVNKKSIEELGSRFDSNNGDLIIGNETQNAMKYTTSTKIDLLEAKHHLKPREELTDEEDITQDLRQQEELDASASCSYNNIGNDIEIVYENSQPSESLLAPRQLHLWKKGEDLKRPCSSALKKNVDRVTPLKRKCETPSRRRPNTVVPLTSSRLGEKYELLVDKKLELVECLKREHQLRMEALQLDILLKKKQLNIITNKDSNECLLESQVLF